MYFNNNRTVQLKLGVSHHLMNKHKINLTVAPSVVIMIVAKNERVL